jgi:hypothetical protein
LLQAIFRQHPYGAINVGTIVNELLDSSADNLSRLLEWDYRVLIHIDHRMLASKQKRGRKNGVTGCARATASMSTWL